MPSMRTLQAEPGQDGFDAEKLFSPPLVYVWIPMSLLAFICIFCGVRYALRRRKKGESRQHSRGPQEETEPSSTARNFVFFVVVLYDTLHLTEHSLNHVQSTVRPKYGRKTAS